MDGRSVARASRWMGRFPGALPGPLRGPLLGPSGAQIGRPRGRAPPTSRRACVSWLQRNLLRPPGDGGSAPRIKGASSLARDLPGECVGNAVERVGVSLRKDGSPGPLSPPAS
eukprot:scaffold3043_cov360-Prasinococcus_capsulatus_cf.AAC.7